MREEGKMKSKICRERERDGGGRNKNKRASEQTVSALFYTYGVSHAVKAS